MARLDRGYAAHKGFRIFLPHPDSFVQKQDGTFLVHVEIGGPIGEAFVSISIPDCVAASYPDALQLSVDNAMHLINTHAPELTPLHDKIPVPQVRPAEVAHM